jgi:hypothetical protein
MFKRKISIHRDMTVKDLAGVLDLPESTVIKELFMLGFMRTVNQIVEQHLARTLAHRLGYEIIGDDPPEDDTGSPKIVRKPKPTGAPSAAES